MTVFSVLPICAFVLVLLFIVRVSRSAQLLALMIVSAFPFGLLLPGGRELYAVQFAAPLFLATLFAYYTCTRGRLWSAVYTPFGIVTVVLVLSFAVHILRAAQGVSRPSSGIFALEGAGRYFFTIVNTSIFLAVAWLTDNEEYDAKPILRILAVLSIAMGILRIVTYYLSIDLPFLVAGFRYAQDRPSEIYRVAYRIGGLDAVACLGGPALLALYDWKEKWLRQALLFAALATLTLIGGGRLATIGLLAILLFYGAFISRPALKRILPMLALSAVVCCAVLIALRMPYQLERILSLTSRIAETDPGRVETYRIYWREFLRSPLFGKGVGFMESGSVADDGTDFVHIQLYAGGHGAYLSMLAIFGLVGGIYLLVFVLGSFVLGVRLLWRRSAPPPVVSASERQLVIFGLLFVIAAGIRYVGNLAGYDDQMLFVVSGILCGIAARRRHRWAHALHRKRGVFLSPLPVHE